MNEAGGGSDGWPYGDWGELRPRLLAYLESFRGLSLEDAEDILQAVSLKLLRGGQNPDNHIAWAYRVTRNAALDALKARRRAEAHLDRLGDDLGDCGHPLCSAYPGPEAELMRSQELAFVTVFLSGLGRSDREILYLAFAEDLPYAEIAKIVGRPLGTIKWRMSRLRQALAKAYGREYGERR